MLAGGFENAEAQSDDIVRVLRPVSTWRGDWPRCLARHR